LHAHEINEIKSREALGGKGLGQELDHKMHKITQFRSIFTFLIQNFNDVQKFGGLALHLCIARRLCVCLLLSPPSCTFWPTLPSLMHAYLMDDTSMQHVYY